MQSLLDSAVDHHLADRLGEADAMYQQVLATSPDHPVALHLSGLIAHQKGRNEAAKELITRALAIEPGYYEAQSNLGLVLAELGRLDEAMEFHRKALAINPSYAEAHNNLGNALQTAGRYQDAVASYHTALNIDPASPDTLSNLGSALTHLQRPHDALEYCRRAVVLAPGSPDNLINLGHVLKALEQLEGAASVYSKVLTHQPDDVRALGNLAGTLQALSRHDEAAGCYVRAFAASPPGAIPIMWLYSASQLPVEIPDCDLAALIEVARPHHGQDEADFESWRGFARASLRHLHGQHDDAWQHLATANSWPARQMATPAAERAESRHHLLDRVRAGVTPAQLASPDEDEPPATLFILGPSRSGKTTLERLISPVDGVRRSHERALLHDAMRQTCLEAGVTTPSVLADLPSSHAASFRRHFRQQLAIPAGQLTQAVSNTNPYHIQDVLPAAALLPGARFAFVKRDIDDITLRIFMKRYASGNHHAYDVAMITDYIAWYNQMIDALAERLPDTSTVIRYEDMIAAPAATQHNIAQLCNIELTGAPLPDLGDDRGCATPYAAHLKAARAQAAWSTTVSD